MSLGDYDDDDDDDYYYYYNYCYYCIAPLAGVETTVKLHTLHVKPYTFNPILETSTG